MLVVMHRYHRCPFVIRKLWRRLLEQQLSSSRGRWLNSDSRFFAANQSFLTSGWCVQPVQMWPIAYGQYTRNYHCQLLLLLQWVSPNVDKWVMGSCNKWLDHLRRMRPHLVDLCVMNVLCGSRIIERRQGVGTGKTDVFDTESIVR